MPNETAKKAMRQKVLIGFSAVAVITGVQAYRVFRGVSGIDGGPVPVSLRETEPGVFWTGVAVWTAVCLCMTAVVVKLLLISLAEKKSNQSSTAQRP
jgi:hypothetical protein